MNLEEVMGIDFVDGYPLKWRIISTCNKTNIDGHFLEKHHYFFIISMSIVFWTLYVRDSWKLNAFYFMVAQCNK